MLGKPRIPKDTQDLIDELKAKKAKEELYDLYAEEVLDEATRTIVKAQDWLKENKEEIK